MVWARLAALCKRAWGAQRDTTFSKVARTGRLLVEDTESQDYEVLGPNTPTHVPTDPRHRADILDIVYKVS
ncbi:hypothetical protein EVAR_21781_1 [Eumeta japonica]|uniref:Uncharacterized protein n=1 Tax=Eumeta variegata TaxID=151549 RepID=A0A4C1ZJL9_EUMVA|nr:hypothetical protein EVAR_21781_1 [Eumeta japonica]